MEFVQRMDAPCSTAYRVRVARPKRRQRRERVVDLQDEFGGAQGRLRPEHLDWLVNGLGVTPSALVRARHVGAGTVLPGVDVDWPTAGTYLPGSVGSSREVGAMILGVWSRLYDDRLEPWAMREFGPAELRDLVAVDVRDPSRWWMRRGAGFNPPTWLGQGFGPAVGDENGVVDLHPTPIDWLRAGCAGKVLLDAAGWELYDLFHAIKYVRVADERYAGEIYKALRAGDRRCYPDVRIHANIKEGLAA